MVWVWTSIDLNFSIKLQLILTAPVFYRTLHRALPNLVTGAHFTHFGWNTLHVRKPNMQTAHLELRMALGSYANSLKRYQSSTSIPALWKPGAVACEDSFTTDSCWTCRVLTRPPAVSTSHYQRTSCTFDETIILQITKSDAQEKKRVLPEEKFG